MSYIIKKCLYCQQPFKANLREHKRGYAKYCCISHASKDTALKYYKKKNQPNCVCAYCSKPFYKSKSKQSKSRSGLFFCCREHKNLAQRIGGIREIMPAHYGTSFPIDYRSTALRELPNKCNRCGYSRFTEALMVHHKDCDRSNNSLSNLEILCPTCHWEHHLGLI